MIKKILRDHLASILAILAIIFLATIAVAYVWGISYLIFDINEINGHATTNTQVPQFNLSAAAQLNYRGTLQQPQ
jgi:hypothetical protein